MINAIRATATRPQPTISALRRLSRRSHSHSSLGASPGRTGARAPGSDAGTIRFMAPSSTICSALGNDPIPLHSATSILATTPTNDTRPRLSGAAWPSVLKRAVPHRPPQETPTLTPPRRPQIRARSEPPLGSTDDVARPHRTVLLDATV